MNKVQVGTAPSPNIKVVRSKIGSLENANYKPGGGKVKIESKKLDFKNAGSRIEAKNDKYAPKGGEKKVSIFIIRKTYHQIDYSKLTDVGTDKKVWYK